MSREVPTNSIEELAQALAPGEQAVGLICCFCGGGNGKERSFNMRRDDNGLLARYRCHRASCGRTGVAVVGDGGGATVEPRSAGQGGQAGYRHPLAGIPDCGYESLWCRWRISRESADGFGLRWIPPSQYPSSGPGGRVCIPLRGFDQRRFGFVFRALDKDYRGRKSVTVLDGTDGGCAVFARMGISNDNLLAAEGAVVIVEDPLSAIRCAALGHTGVALLGTYLDESRLRAVFAGAGTRRVILALDRDATAKAIETAARYGYLGALDVRPLLGPDLKDLDDESIRAFLS